MHYEETTALITGASSGVGEEFARALASRGADVVLVARRHDVLDRLANDIRTATGRRVHVMATDLSEPGAGTRLATELNELGIRVDTVINNAGVGKTEPFSAASATDIEQQLRLNINAVVDISHALLPGLLDHGRGTLLNVASLTGYAPTPGMAVYAASKAFVLRFTEALAYELRDSSVTVMALAPGPTRTNFYSASGTSEGGVRFQTPAQVVATALTALEQKRPPVSIVSGWRNRWSSRLLTILPRRTVMKMMAG